MNQDDDVERLFSWLQTPEIRYREFAGAREVTDTVATLQVRTNTPEIDPPAPHNVQLDEEYPADQFPDQSQTEVVVEPPATPPPGARVEPTIAAPAPVPAPPASEGGPFALGASGRPAPAAPPLSTPPAPAIPEPSAPEPAAAPAPPAPAAGQEQPARSLDSVFNRLSSGRNAPPDPRDRLRNIPGLGTHNDRSR